MDRMVLRLFLLPIIVGVSAAGLDAQRRKAAPKSAGSATRAEYRPPSDDERRRNVEARMLKGEYQHDGSGDLMYIGTIESVPALLKVLQDHPPSVEEVKPVPPPVPGKPPNPPQSAPRKTYICTYVHAVHALQKITGQNLIEYQEWTTWWERYREAKQLPKP